MPAESDNRKRSSRKDTVGVCLVVGFPFFVIAVFFCLATIYEFSPVVSGHDIRRRIDEGVLSVEQVIEKQIPDRLREAEKEEACSAECFFSPEECNADEREKCSKEGMGRVSRKKAGRVDSIRAHIRAHLEEIDTSLSSRRYRNEWNTWIVVAPQVGGTFLSLWNRIGNALSSRSFRDERDGRIYRTVKIGKQEWMAQNLDFCTRKFCFDEKPENCGPDGGLYTLDAAREACPDGWRLPTKEEWRTLRDYHIYNYAFARGDSIVPWHDLFRRPLGARLRGKGLLIAPLFKLILSITGATNVFGDEPNAITATFASMPHGEEKGGMGGYPRKYKRYYVWAMPTRADESATAMYRSESWCPEGKTCDALGFEAIPAGMRSHDGVYRSRGALAGFWASDAGLWAKGPCVFLVDSKTDGANLSCDDHVSYPSSVETYDPQGAYSVRCIKD